MSQTRLRDDFVHGIRLRVYAVEVRADLLGNGPDVQLAHCGGQVLIVESIRDPAELM